MIRACEGKSNKYSVYQIRGKEKVLSTLISTGSVTLVMRTIATHILQNVFSNWARVYQLQFSKYTFVKVILKKRHKKKFLGN